uniref:NADH-ubiquinone oxidoreductase chain 2 n=1 Tax=Nuchequula nuchalis TaxID=218810 RepID=A0A0B6VQX4_NUCNU|nr:NADH dehydrogenase subunit 2 [Leiognathus brevirostris]UNI91565.1 NADH dehydrogenase subunit 2 [Leiognathus brevirostris]BAQ20826.1 NADH dehydrogenase subunit 2 [Nuchequula nuchalis]
MNPYISTILFSGLALGTTITLTSSHWLMAWMGLEINTLAIIPLMSQHHHPRATEAATKYFLTQATAAAIMLFSATLNAWLTGLWHIQELTHPMTTTMMLTALALKLGLAPIHSWMPDVMQGLDLLTGLVMSTWQKLAPFILLIQIQPNAPQTITALGLLSTLIGGWGGLNQTQLRKILAYSSIAHLGWMALIMQFSSTLALLTLLTYFIMSIATFMLFKTNKTTTINTLALSSTKLPMMTAIAPLLLLSLGGLPPLTGFMPKWMIIQELTKQDLAPLATIAAISALLSLFFYLRLSYNMTLTMFPNIITATTPWRLPLSKPSLPLAISATASLLLLPLTPTIIAMLTP